MIVFMLLADAIPCVLGCDKDRVEEAKTQIQIVDNCDKCLCGLEKS